MFWGFPHIIKTQTHKINKMQTNDFIQANRKMWNETAAIHAQGYVSTLWERIKAPDYSTFDAVERRIFAQIGLADKTVIQLCCNNGRELIAIKKAGAKRCVGIDISDNFIAQGQQLAQHAGVEVDFVRSNVYDIGAEFDGQFDLVYITIGAMGWLPNLDAFFGLIARLLKPNGQLFIYEMHPILNMFDASKGLVVDSSYFRVEPFADENSPDYYEPTQRVSTTAYWFPHKLSDVIGGCLKHKLNLTHFEEYAHDLSMVFAAFEQLEKKPPLSYSLLAQKQ